MPPSIVDPATAREPGGGRSAQPALLEVDGLVAGYGGGDVLKGVDFCVPRGSITCIVGPNGAGKSTLLAAVSGMLTPRRGRVCFDGRDIVGCSPREVLLAGMVLVPQNHSLFRNMTVRENVRLGGFTLRDKALVQQRLKAVEELFPVVAERANDKAGSLSGGQQRLVEFARGLDARPRVGGAGRTVDGPRPQDPEDRLPHGAPDERDRPHDTAGRAERPCRPSVELARGRAGERAGPLAGQRPGGAGASRDRGALPRWGRGPPGGP